MVLLLLVPRPLGSLTLLLHALHGHATAGHTATTGSLAVDVSRPVDVARPAAPGLPPAVAPPSPAACEAESNDEEDAALAMRFGFHV